MAKAAPKNVLTKAEKPKLRKPKTVKKIATKKIPSDVPSIDAHVLDRLFGTVEARRTADPAHSHSARLLSRGTRKVAQKFGEEAVECLIEAVAGNKRELVGESADVLYHLIVMWVDAGLQPDEIWQELQRREGVSGVAEKASRPVTLAV